MPEGLSGQDLCGKNYSGANLTGADLSGANLSDADLSEANLTGANLTRADLAAADLIAREAGGFVGDHTGAAFTYNRPSPVQASLVCSTPALAPLILARVGHIALPT